MTAFVSYGSSDRDVIEPLVTQLGALGCDVRFEYKYMDGRVTWGEVFESIRSSDMFIAVLSRKRARSVTGKLELDYARALGKQIVLILPDDRARGTFADETIARPGEQSVAWRADNPRAAEALRAVIEPLLRMQRRRVTRAAPTPNYLRALADVRDRIDAMGADVDEQITIVRILRDFLERSETYQAALTMLQTMQNRAKLDTRTSTAIAQTLRQVRDQRPQRRAARQRERAIVATGAAITAAALLVLGTAAALPWLRAQLSEPTAQAAGIEAQASDSLVRVSDDEAVAVSNVEVTLYGGIGAPVLRPNEASISLYGGVGAPLGAAPTLYGQVAPLTPGRAADALR